MTDESLAEEIYLYIKSELNYSNDFNVMTNIVKEGLVDSTGVLMLVSFLENRYRVEIDFEDITQDNFSNVGSIVQFIKKLHG
jgi:acyl carrier protein